MSLYAQFPRLSRKLNSAMGFVKTRRLAYPPLAGVRDPWGSEHAERKRVPSDASSFAKAFTFDEATVDKSEDKETTTCHPPSPRLRRIKGHDEDADEERCREGRCCVLVARWTQGQSIRIQCEEDVDRFVCFYMGYPFKPH